MYSVKKADLEKCNEIGMRLQLEEDKVLVIKKSELGNIFYEVEEFDDGTFQIDCGEEAKENYENEIKQGCKRKRFIELKGGGENGI